MFVLKHTQFAMILMHVPVPSACGRLFAHKDSLLHYYFISLSFMRCLYQNTQFGMSLLFSELIHTQQEVKLFGPAFSRSCIFSRP